MNEVNNLKRGLASLKDVPRSTAGLDNTNFPGNYGEIGMVGYKEKLDEGKITQEQFDKAAEKFGKEDPSKFRDDYVIELAGDIGAFYGKDPKMMYDVLGVRNARELVGKYGGDINDFSSIMKDHESLKALANKAGLPVNDELLDRFSKTDPLKLNNAVQDGFLRSGKHHKTYKDFLSNAFNSFSELSDTEKRVIESNKVNQSKDLVGGEASNRPGSEGVGPGIAAPIAKMRLKKKLNAPKETELPDGSIQIQSADYKPGVSGGNIEWTPSSVAGDRAEANTFMQDTLGQDTPQLGEQVQTPIRGIDAKPRMSKLKRKLQR